MKIARFLVALLLLCSASVWAAELKSDYQQGERRPPEPRVIPQPPVLAQNPIAHLMNRCRVLPGHHYRGLTVFPVEVVGYGLSLSLLTLDEALARHVLIITEKGEGQVPVLRVENRGAEYVFIMSGEILVGGKQNRILRQDVLLPPYSGPVVVPAYCVEQGRWVAKADRFASDGNLASPRIRARVQMAAPQATIWSGVSEMSQALGQQAPAGDLNYVYNKAEVAGKVREYREEFCRILPRHVIGMVVGRNGEIVGADLFGDSDLFFRLRNKALDSYAIDILGRVVGDAPIPDIGAVQRFLQRVLAASYWTEPTPGVGVAGRAFGNGIDARGLIWNGSVVHVAVFPTAIKSPRSER